VGRKREKPGVKATARYGWGSCPIRRGEERREQWRGRPQWQLDSGGTVPGGAPLQQRDSDATTWGCTAPWLARGRGVAERSVSREGSAVAPRGEQLWAGPQGGEGHRRGSVSRWPGPFITRPQRFPLGAASCCPGDSVRLGVRSVTRAVLPPLVHARSNWPRPHGPRMR
jgi:hypothetical protein